MDADLKGYFDSIPPPLLKARIEERISDGHLLELLAGWLQQNIVKGLERWTPTGGTPQGAVISPLLANIYLHPLDERMATLGYRMVRKKSLQGFVDKIREKTRRTRGDSMARIIADLTPTIRGWFGYFKDACRWVFPKLDKFIRRRLRAILRKQDKRPGFGRCHVDHKRWPNYGRVARSLV